MAVCRSTRVGCLGAGSLIIHPNNQPNVSCQSSLPRRQHHSFPLRALNPRAMGGGAGGSDPPPPPPEAGEAKDKPFKVDRALQSLGFEFTRVTATEVTGRLPVTETCCQPFDWLNGGVSALMAEVTASIGCYVASGYRRLAGVQLSINHVEPARLGDLVQATAKPIQLGRKIQVWEVQIWRIDPSTSECKDLISTARVTLLANLSTPQSMTTYEQGLKKFQSKL